MPSTAPPEPLLDSRAPSAQNIAASVAAIQQVHLASDAAELLALLHEAVTAIGASAGVYVAVIPESASDDSVFSLFACEPQFATEQAALGPIQQHPWVRFAQGHTLPATDQQLPVLDTADAAAIQLAAKYGFKSYLVVPTGNGINLRRVEMLCIGCDQPAAFEGAGARAIWVLARSLASELHDWLTLRLSQSLRQDARLQATDVQLLHMEWHGLSTKAISQRTGLSIASVDSRFQRLNRKLNCRSRAASAQRAAEYGLLELP